MCRKASGHSWLSVCVDWSPKDPGAPLIALLVFANDPLRLLDHRNFGDLPQFLGEVAGCRERLAKRLTH